MNRSILVLLAGASLLWTAGCTTKSYVRNQSAPVINKTNELDDITAKNSRDIRDVDSRAQKGISDVNERASAADQKATNAAQSADQAQTLATQAVNRVDSLQNAVANLDNYHPVAETEIHFGFDKADLTTKGKDALDQLGAEIPNAKGYIVEVTGGADSAGSKDYNYQLSERRADAVVQYLISKYNVPAYKVYLVGLGKDKEVAPNNSATGRAKNRRVSIRLLTNSSEGNTSAQISGQNGTVSQNSPQSR